MKRFLPILPFLFCACSADLDSQLPDLPLSSEAISLYSGIGDITAGQTRGKGIIESPLTTGLPISFVRLDKPLSGSYPSDYTDATALSGQLSISNRVEFDASQLYLADGGDTKFVGWYPGTDAEATNNPNPSSWNANTGKVTIAVDGTTDIMATTSAAGSKSNRFSDTQHRLTFNHMLTQARVFIYADGTASQAAWGKLTGVALAGKAQTCTLTLPTASAVPSADGEGGVATGASPTASFSTTGASDLALQKLDNSGPAATTSASLTLATTAPNTAKDTPIGYAMFAPHTSESDKLTLKVTTAKGGTQSVDIDYAETNADFRPGYIYNVVLKLTASDIVLAGITITPWNDGGTANGGIGGNDLPEGWKDDIDWAKPLVFTGESNCYIVPPGGQLLIPISRAKVFADSDAGQDIDGNNTKMPVIAEGEEFYASVIWTDNKSALTPVSETRKAEDILYCIGTGPNGYILVKVGTEKGNAVVGLRKKNSDGTYTTLWSWHVWVTDDPTATTYTTTNGYTFMDRNLGATRGAQHVTDYLNGTTITDSQILETYGVLYQWGRKDPFPGSNAVSGTTDKTIYGPTGATTTISKTGIGSTPVSMAASIQAPLSFYWMTDGYEWCSDDIGTSSTRWNSSTDTKTLYDPCPAGWRVPVQLAFSTFSTSTLTPWTVKGHNSSSLGWWPAGGYRGGDNGAGKMTSAGTFTLCWIATPYPWKENAARRLRMYSVNILAESWDYIAFGLSVRCARE